MNAFCATISQPDKRVDAIISTASQEKVAKNRAILTSIIKCVEFCGRNGIALRGHRDDSTSTDISQGKFKALVKFHIDSGDESHLDSCSNRETYMSKMSQNQLLQCMGNSSVITL